MNRSRRGLRDPHDEQYRPANGKRLKLKAGDRIRLEYPHGGASAGIVDEHTADYSVVWVHLDHGLGRTMLLAEDQAAIVRQPAVSYEKAVRQS